MPKYVEAVFDFAGSDGQLSFGVGQLIEVTQEGEPNEWWEGVLNGQAGWFPSAYCSPPFQEGFDAAEAAWGEAEPGAPQQQARALYDFPASAEDELGFNIGDLISVSEAEGSWWMGSLNGRSGTFPSNYVELLEEGDSATAGSGDDLASRLAAALASKRTSQPQQASPRGGRLSRALSNSKIPAHAAPISNTLVSLDPSQQMDDDGGDDWDAPPQAEPLAFAQRPVHSDSWILGTRPAWQQPAFEDMFVACHTKESDKKRPPLINLMLCMELLSKALKQLASETMPSSATARAVNSAAKAMEEALVLVKMLPSSLGGSERDVAAMEGFLKQLTTRIKTLGVGECLLVPGTWSTPEGEDAVLYAVHRGPSSKFAFTVVSAGLASAYHPMGVEPTTAEFLHNTALAVQHVPEERIGDSAFWFLLFRAHVSPKAKFGGAEAGPRFVYETLIPFLNSRPLLANVTADRQSEWKPLPAGGAAAAPSHVAFEAVRHIMCYAGLVASNAAHMVVLLRWTVMRMAESDMRIAKEISPSQAAAVRVSCQQLGAYASEQTPPMPADLLGPIKATIDSIELKVQILTADHTDPATLPLPSSCVAQGGANYPYVGRLRNDVDVERLAGSSKEPPILLPVQLTLVPEAVAQFEDVSLALRHCDELCTRLANQHHLVRNSLPLRLALIQHTVVEVVPLPLPLPRPPEALADPARDPCFWRRAAMRHETQADLMRLLLRLSRHYLAACLSLPNSTHLDGTRCIVMAAIACLADAVLRTHVYDCPSLFATHWAGRAGGPTSAFGFGLGGLEIETDSASLLSPTLAAARVQVLDYAATRLEALAPNHQVFQFERSMRLQPADLELLKQLCLATGFPPHNLPAYFCEAAPTLVNALPEFGMLRDIVFGLKMLMAATLDAIPSPGQWSPLQARFSWSYVVESELLQVSAFGEGTLRCAGEEEAQKKKRRGLFQGADAPTPRVPLSLSSASNLVGEEVATEDDVLHVKSLPEFGIRMRGHDAELLLQYLTVPYLRVPLLLRFFADRSRLKTLLSPAVQAVLDAALFEPGAWAPPQPVEVPEAVPVSDRAILSTPAGLLIQELRYAPLPLTHALAEMLELALEMDVGRYVGTSSPVVLYVLRLLARVEGYVALVLRTMPHARGLQPVEAGGAVEANLAVLREQWGAVRAVLRARAVPMLEGWCGRAVQERELQVACGLHAHLVLLHRGFAEDETAGGLTAPTVRALLSAQVFININWRAPPAGEAAAEVKGQAQLPSLVPALLGVLQFEIFDTFQRLRWPLLRWLQAHREECNTVMEAVVRTITFANEGQAERALAQQIQARQWTTLLTPGDVGRFVPDTEHSLEQRASQAATYEAYLRAQTEAVDTEVNMQLGEYTLKKNTLKALPVEIGTEADFISVFGVSLNANPIQCVTVQESTHRRWLRLVGQRHDVQLWDADTRLPVPPAEFSRRYIPPNYGEDVPDDERTADMLTKGERWISDIFEPFRKQYMQGCDLQMQNWQHESLDFCCLAGIMQTSAERPSVKEVVVFRCPPVVHVYNVVSHARRFYRTLIFSSDNAFCLYDMPCTPFLQGERPRLVAGDPRTDTPSGPSLLITRNLSRELGTQTYVPTRLLRGLLPATLLESYTFWQDEAGGSLVGYPHESAASALKATRLQLTLFPDGDPDMTGFGGARASLVLKRVPVILGGDTDAAAVDGESKPRRNERSLREMYNWTTATAEPDSSRPVMTLLNLLHATANGALRQLADVLMRLENLSHVLVWSSSSGADPNEKATIDLVELPRLRLHFRAMPDERGRMRLASVEHAGLFVATRCDERTAGLLQGLPHSLLLENANGEQFVLLSAATLPSRPALAAAKLSSEVLLDRSNKAWLTSIGNAPAYLYAVHVGLLTLGAPTFASGLYLLLMRWLGRQHQATFRMASCCVSDTPLSAEEAQIFNQFGALSHDVEPDAHAIRLKISLVTRGTAHGAHASARLWVLRDEYASYVRKFRYVSALCRLSIAEELCLLSMVDTDQSPALYNRRMFVRAVAHTDSGVPTPPISLRYPPQPAMSYFDTSADQIYLGSDKDKSTSEEHWWSRFATLSYSRPEETLGGATIEALDKWLNNGLTVGGGKDGLGFLLFYELMTGSLSLRILPTDSPFILGALMVRMLPPAEFRKKDQLMAILRMLTYNPHLAKDMPKFADTRKFKMTKKVLKNSDMIKSLFLGVKEFLLAHQAQVKWPKQRPPFRAMAMLKVPSMAELLTQQRLWLSAHVLDFACDSRSLGPVRSGGVSFDDVAIAAFAGKPLEVLGIAAYISERPKAGVSADGASLLPDVTAHGAGDNPLAAAMLARLKADLEHYQATSRQGTDTTFNLLSPREVEGYSSNPDGPPAQQAAQHIRQLVATLEQLMADDHARLLAGMKEAEAAANRANGSFQLAQYAGAEARISFELLVALLVCAHGETTLAWINPSLDDAQMSSLLHLTSGTMLVAARLGHASRCRAGALKLLALLGRFGGGADAWEGRQALVQQGQALAELMTARRCYMSPVANGGVAFDPRLLAFEYAFNLLLRPQQVELVHQFVSSAHAEQSRVNQMIMGQGKTTVVAPLLALMLGNNRTLVMQVVPPALLEFSRSIMRQRFSSILQKPVYTFNFDRFTAASPELLSKILQARSLSAVMISSPTSIKSFMLKFIEVVHQLELAATSMNLDDEDEYMRGVNANPLNRMRRLKRTASETAVMRGATAVPQLSAQARVAVNIVKELQTSVLMLDEVDMILHPLKSELNWPLGKRKPLDYGASRWAVPFHLLDALFYCDPDQQTPRMPERWKGNGAAQALLDRLRAAVQFGLERKVLQRTPHLILLSRPFYVGQLKPLLCRWMLLWVRKSRLRELKDEEVLAYMMHGPRAHPDTAALVERMLTDKFVKMLNLSHAWLDQLLPHVLSKINRVNYGLLSAEQQQADMPTSRKLLAVPFLGKDVPSPASEYAHPDIVIGFTILAYRHEGMRRDDFKKVMRALLEELEFQGGPVESRPAYRTFSGWVAAAGGRVRGTRVEPGAPDVPAEFANVWPLQLLDVADEEQSLLLLKLLSRLPQLVEHYLSEYTFPQTMLHQALKLSANAQELGGDLLFRVRLGFSGTPSDLLPLELGTCNYAAGDDAKMLHILTSTDNVTYNPLPFDWSVDSLLGEIANASPAFHALIDTGALVTGLTNLQVAQQLLLRGLPEVDAVIFLDSLDRKMALLRVGFKVVELAECGVALERRFTFYDQVHTTGMDIEQLLSAHAVLTLGKDMVFRDFAQGAFRLRKIGQGQHMTIFIIPEVMQLIGSHMARCRRMSVGDYGAWFAGLAPQQQLPQMLRDVVAWLLLNSMLSERTQYKLLCEQNLASVWRKRAYRNLLQDWELFAEEAKGGHANAQRLQTLTPSVGVFREGVDFGVENTVPVQQDYVQKLTQRAADNHELCEGDEERAAVNHVINSVVKADFGKARVPSAAPKARAGGAPPAPPKALVIFAYEPQYEGDLALAEGDKVRVVSRGEDGWWEGECKGRRGRFPASYVQVDDDDAPAEGAGDDAVMAFNVEEVQEQEQEQEQEEEQQKQQEAEQEYDAPEAPEEAARQKYSREDEAIVQWPLTALDQPPTGSEHACFYSWSDFRVFNQAPGQASGTPGTPPSVGLRFPPCLQLSQNFYKPRHAEKPRRVKNTIVCMEWRPHGCVAGEDRLAAMASLGATPEALLASVYALCGGTEQQGIPVAQVWELWRALELEVDLPEEQARLAEAMRNAHVLGGAGGTADLRQLCELMHPSVLQPVTQGRYFMAISLAEAESLRAVMHSRQGRPFSLVEGSRCTLAMHLLRRTGEEAVQLEASHGHRFSTDCEAQMAHQCLRYIDSELDFTSGELTLLLRGVQDNETRAREAFFLAVRASRRRAQAGSAGFQVSSRPVARMFAMAHEYYVLHSFAVMSRIRLLLQQHGLYTLDAFRAFNAAGNGLMSCSELYGGLRWLGMDVGPPDIYEMVRRMDGDGDGFVSFDEFRLAVGSEADTEMWAHESDEPPHLVGISLADLKPIPIRELFDEEDSVEAKQQLQVPQHMLNAIKLKLQKLERLDELWRSAGIASKTKVSVWDGRLSTKRLARNRTRVCLGHFATNSWSSPRGEKLVLELTDMSVNGFTPSKWLESIVYQSLPHPARFHRVWGLQTGTVPIFFWQPIPPSADYVPLGMVTTRTEEPPSIKMVHCLPRNWVEPAPQEVKMLWSDAGNSGKPGSIWAVGQLQLLGAALANEPPSHISWRLKHDRFTLADSDMLVPSASVAPPPPGDPQSYSVRLQIEGGSAGAPPPPRSDRTTTTWSDRTTTSSARSTTTSVRPSSGLPPSSRHDERVSVLTHGGSTPKPPPPSGPPPIAEHRPVVTNPWTVAE